MAKVGRCVDAGRFLQGYFWNGEWMIPLYLLVLGVLATEQRHGWREN